MIVYYLDFYVALLTRLFVLIDLTFRPVITTSTFTSNHQTSPYKL